MNSVISDMYMGFKIVPYVSSKRNKDMFNFQLKNNTPALPASSHLNISNDFFNYKQAYFYYNNTVGQFPSFEY